jgi:hypothetical protein
MVQALLFLPVCRMVPRRIALGMVRCGMVRRGRAALLKAGFITAQINPAIAEESGNDLDRQLATVSREPVVVDSGLPARIFSEAADTLANTLARYETALEYRLCRCLNQVERLQRLRQGEKTTAPASTDIAVHG